MDNSSQQPLVYSPSRSFQQTTLNAFYTQSKHAPPTTTTTTTTNPIPQRPQMYSQSSGPPHNDNHSSNSNHKSVSSMINSYNNNSSSNNTTHSSQLSTLQQLIGSSASQQIQLNQSKESILSRISRNIFPQADSSSNYSNTADKKPRSVLEQLALSRNTIELDEDDDIVEVTERQEDDCVEIIGGPISNKNDSMRRNLFQPVGPKQLFPSSSSASYQQQKLTFGSISGSGASMSGGTTTPQSTASSFNFLNQSSAPQKTSQDIINELELKQFQQQRAQEKAARQAMLTSPSDDIKLSSTSRFQIDPAVLNAERLKRSELFQVQRAPALASSAINNTIPINAPASIVAGEVMSTDSSDDDISGDEGTKKQRLNNNSDKRLQMRRSIIGVKYYYDQLSEKQAKKDKIRMKEEEKAARIRQELIDAAQQKEKERIEAERRAQREKLVQIKRAEEVRKRKAAANLQAATTLEYRNRMREQLRSMNLDEKLSAANATNQNNGGSNSSGDPNSTGGVLSIAGNTKRSMMDFDFLSGDPDEAVDNNNYYALLRFVFSQDFNRADILQIENKRIPNKFSNWKEYFSIFEYLFMMECVANIQQAFTSFRSHENFRQPLGCYVKPVSTKENAHGFLELQVCRRGADLDEGEIGSSMEDDYYTLTAMRNHAVLISSTSDMQLATLSNKPQNQNQPFLFFGWVVPPDKSDPKSALKLYVDIEQATLSAIFDDAPLVFVSVFNFTKMTTFIREYLAIKNMRESALNRFIYNPIHIVESKTAISNPCKNSCMCSSPLLNLYYNCTII